MPTPDILPFTTLLAPITTETPTGDNPRKSSELFRKFDAIRNAFSSADVAERQEARGFAEQPNSDDKPSKPPVTPAKLWEPVIAPTIELLATHTKDLEVANWLVQALVRVEGLRGIRDGLKLIAELCERYWDGLHPLPGSDDEDLEPGEKPEDQRFPLFERLQTQPILTTLRLTPITGKKGGGPFSYSDYANAGLLELTTGSKYLDESAAEARRQLGRERKANITATATETGADFYIALLEDMALASQHMGRIDSLVMEKTGGGLALGNLREVLDEITRAVRNISRGIIPEAPEPATASKDADGVAGVSSGGGFRASGTNAGQDRENALRCLAQIAAFFKATEPHSPIGYSLDTVIARARMPLPALLEDLLSDTTARDTFLTTAGIRLPAPKA
jgi:type VI secretion system protein ImpA